MKQRILYLFTRTPLHVGAGSSVGAIDQPVIRERHTGFPIIPASSLKGSFADQWPSALTDEKGIATRVTTRTEEEGDKKRTVLEKASETAWLFGSDTTKLAFAGSLVFAEARVLAFPIRSARGSYAWITCPLMLQRAARDGVFSAEVGSQVGTIAEPQDSQEQSLAIFQPDPLGLGEDKKQLVLEEYCFARDAQPFPDRVAASLAALLEDELLKSIAHRLVILSNGMMSHFAMTACDVAQHVRISDETGTAEGTGLFNQENVPADTLFYSVLSASRSRVPGGDFKSRSEDDALEEFASKVTEEKLFQFGGDASTGLGFCSASTNLKTNPV